MTKANLLLLCLLADRPITTTTALRAGGVHPRAIAAAIESGALVRLAHGQVTTAAVAADPLLDDAVACMRTGGVICHLSAAMRHNLCDALPSKLEMMVPAEYTKTPAGLPIRWRRGQLPARRRDPHDDGREDHRGPLSA